MWLLSPLTIFPFPALDVLASILYHVTHIPAVKSAALVLKHGFLNEKVRVVTRYFKMSK